MRYFLTFLLILFLSGTALAFRIPRPSTFSEPLDRDQINKLNTVLNNLWNLTNGEYNLDIVTTSKTQADNGDVWIINDGGTFKLEFQAGDSVRSITVD